MGCHLDKRWMNMMQFMQKFMTRTISNTGFYSCGARRAVSQASSEYVPCTLSFKKPCRMRRLTLDSPGPSMQSSGALEEKTLQQFKQHINDIEAFLAKSPMNSSPASGPKLHTPVNAAEVQHCLQVKRMHTYEPGFSSSLAASAPKCVQMI